MGMGSSTGKARRAIAILLAVVSVATGAVLTAAAPAAAEDPAPFAVMPDLAVVGYDPQGMGSTPRSLAVSDLQGDGKADLAVAYEGDAKVITWAGDGTGGFVMTHRGAAPGGTSAVAVRDMTGDSIPDLVVTGREGSLAYLDIGDVSAGDGTRFPTRRMFSVGGGATDVAVADFNNDGFADYVVPLELTSGVTVALNDGTGRFPSVTSLVPDPGPAAVATGDLNGDGDADIAVSNFGSATVSIFLGHGDGTFLTAPAVQTDRQPLELGIGDFNGDGKPDLAVPSYGSAVVDVRLGNGDGTFRDAADVSVGANPRAVAIADLDGDTKSDLAVTIEGTDTVSVLFGDGTGGFGRAVSVPVGDRPFDVVAADFDGDARPDLAVTNYGSNKVSIRLNRYSGNTAQADLAVTSIVGSYLKPLPLTVAGGSGNGALTYAVLAGGTATGCAISAAAPFTLSTTSPGTCTVQASKAGDPTYRAAQSPATVVTFAKATQATLKVVAETAALPNAISLTTSGGSGTGAVSYALVAGGTAIGCAISAAAPFKLSSTSTGTCLVKATKLTDVNFKQTVSANVTMAFVTTLPVVAIADKTVVEGSTGSTSAAFTVTRTGETIGSSTVTWKTIDQTAAAGQDYVAVPATKLTFDPGVTSVTVTVKIVGDTVVEPNEIFSVALSDPAGATIGDGAGAGRIIDDDTALAVNDVTVVEGGSGAKAATFTITRTGILTGTSTVQWATVAGTATSGTDFTAVAASPQALVTFAANQATKQVTVNVTGDTVAEPDETFSVVLSAPVGASLLDATGVGTITDDDAGLAIGDATVTEGASGSQLATFTITRSGSTTLESTVLWRTLDGTAKAPGDYTAITTPTKVTFAPGVASQTVKVAVLGDTTFEVDETFSVQLSSPTNATLLDATAVGTIATDEVGLAIGDVTVLESEVGTGATFTVTRTGAIDTPVSVFASTADGTAKAPGDYTAVTTPVKLDLAAGVATKAFVVALVGDKVVEPNEDFFVKLTSATGATILDGTALGTITNDDSQVSIADASLVEGQTGSSDMVFTLTRTGATNLVQTVTVHTVDGTAIASTDYNRVDTVVSFAVGATSAQVRVPVLGEVRYEDDEMFNVNLIGTGGTGSVTLADATAVGTILGDDATVSITDASVAEGNTTTNPNRAMFTVGRQGLLNRAVSFTWQTADMEARAGVNYIAVPPTTVTFNPYETWKDLYVSVLGNQIPGANLRFKVNLTNVAWATANTDLQALGTIVNDDEAIDFSVNDVTMDEGASGTTAFTFTVSRNASSRASTVRWETTNNTAVAPGDFTAVTSTLLSFAVGETTKQITVFVKGDRVFEGTEVFHVRLFEANGAGIADDTGTGTIRNDD